jgi:hypothetical protein
MMERLTDYSDDECTYIIGVGNKTCEEFCKYVVDGCKNCYIQQVFKKLADYEDLEEQGLLVRLPCKVGDTVYVPTRNFVSELRITMVSVNMHEAYFSWMLNSGIYPNLDGFSKSKLGKSVFLTREEAEKKLDEMKNEI